MLIDGGSGEFEWVLKIADPAVPMIQGLSSISDLSR
jgi:hypothetical protein